MDSRFMLPDAVIKKLRISKTLSQPLYLYGATGYGKTETIYRYFGNKAFSYYSCSKQNIDFELLPKRYKTRSEMYPVVIDDLQQLRGQKQRAEVLELLERQDLWVILVSRSPVPPWLLSAYIKKSFVVSDERDLRINFADMGRFLSAYGLTLDEDQIKNLLQRTLGNGFVLKLAVMKLAEGRPLDEALWEEVSREFGDYVEHNVMEQWDNDLQDFLLCVSVVDEFTLPLAEMISGNCRIATLLQKATEAGNFLTEKDETYTLRPQLLKALRRRAARILSEDQISECCYNAGLYYEMHDMDVQALEMFERCHSEARIRELLIRNARKHPGIGHYYELRRYYFRLDPKDIQQSAVLMAGMSMLYSLMAQAEESEYWYQKLKNYHENAKGGQKREASSLMLYLEIALPHRGTSSVLDWIKRVPALVLDKGIAFPELAITANLPSTMNGGKDFCTWSRHDRELAATIGKLLERVLGRGGKGLVNLAVAESQFEKGEDIYEVLSLLSKAQLEIDVNDMIEMKFVYVGLQARVNLFLGHIDTAKELLAAFEEEVKRRKADRIYANLAALQCRIALLEGNDAVVAEWMANAPDENQEFYVLDRYRYLTKIRCYILYAKYTEAFALIEKLKHYADLCGRNYIQMELGILTAVVKNRLGHSWKEEFLEVLQKISSFSFYRILSEDGDPVFALLDQSKREALKDPTIDSEWFLRVTEETLQSAKRSPAYLRRRTVENPDFSEAARRILQMQADGYSMSRIADLLEMKQDTVKYHIKQNYRKLGVANKSDAVIIARNMQII